MCIALKSNNTSLHVLYFDMEDMVTLKTDEGQGRMKDITFACSVEELQVRFILSLSAWEPVFFFSFPVVDKTSGPRNKAAIGCEAGGSDHPDLSHDVFLSSACQWTERLYKSDENRVKMCSTNQDVLPPFLTDQVFVY